MTAFITQNYVNKAGIREENMYGLLRVLLMIRKLLLGLKKLFHFIQHNLDQKKSPFRFYSLAQAAPHAGLLVFTFTVVWLPEMLLQ